MVYGGGLQREHDRMDREAAEERAFKYFERWYIYENMRPERIGIWEWRLMFDKLPYHQEMAIELQRTTFVETAYEGCFQAVPDDVKVYIWQTWNRYKMNQSHFIESLVVNGKYPDLPAIAQQLGEANRYLISSHYSDEVAKKHAKWKIDYESLDNVAKAKFNI
jgi:hypothetical protein